MNIRGSVTKSLETQGRFDFRYNPVMRTSYRTFYSAGASNLSVRLHCKHGSSSAGNSVCKVEIAQGFIYGGMWFCISWSLIQRHTLCAICVYSVSLCCYEIDLYVSSHYISRDTWRHSIRLKSIGNTQTLLHAYLCSLAGEVLLNRSACKSIHQLPISHCCCCYYCCCCYCHPPFCQISISLKYEQWLLTYD